VFAADHPAPLEPLGSPFPFDGALHVACAWGQRFHHVVAFPVGFEERSIIKPTARGETYLCEIASVSATEKFLQFDIWIRDSAGSLCEEIRGLVMRDVSVGRVKPPRWVLCRPPVASDA
jgi:Polyketide synthase dehydratase